ncbi:MAG: hypothetical protein ACPGYT_11845 [Nitrospirales bacterium]
MAFSLDSVSFPLPGLRLRIIDDQLLPEFPCPYLGDGSENLEYVSEVDWAEAVKVMMRFHSLEILEEGYYLMPAPRDDLRKRAEESIWSLASGMGISFGDE